MVEAAAARAWPVAETEHLHGWILGCSGAHSRRLNSVQTLAYDADAALDATIAAAETWYEQRRLSPCFRITDAAQPLGLDATLAARGYAVRTPTSVMISKTWPDAATHIPVELFEVANDPIVQAICDPAWSPEVRARRRELFARIEPPHRFALVTVDGTPAAGGLCVADGDFAGLFTMRTQPAHRQQGMARSIARRRIDWARLQGTALLYLQVENDNAPALRLYGELGFERLYGYDYRERP